jgi:acetate kinase
VFTGGIAEHDAEVRALICGALSWLGISLDIARNGSLGNPISTSGSRCQVGVLPAREDDEIARHTWQMAAGVARGRSRSSLYQFTQPTLI